MSLRDRMSDFVVQPSFATDEELQAVGVKRFDPRQRRDERGRWTRVPGTSTGGPTEWEQFGRLLYQNDLHDPYLSSPAEEVTGEWAEPGSPPLTTAEFWSMVTFHHTDSYDALQVATRTPEKLDDYLRADTPNNVPYAQPYFDTVEGDQLARANPRAAAELIRERLHLHDAIVKYGQRPPAGLARITGMRYVPPDIRADLDAGKTVYLEEDGFLSATDNVPAVRKAVASVETLEAVAPDPNAPRPRPDALWHILSGPDTKALRIQGNRRGASEWVFAPGTRYSIKRSNTDPNEYDVTIIDPPVPVP